MIQIRHKIFETNSSSTHCLVIAKDPNLTETITKHKEKFGNKIVFGLNSYEDTVKKTYNVIIDESTDFQTKADMLYFSMYVWNDFENVCEFLDTRNRLANKLKEYGFEVEFREDPALLENENYRYKKYEMEDSQFENMLCDNTMTEVLNYLFNDHVLCYEWCDEGCAECPEEITEAINRFAKYEDENNEEMIIHHYR